MFPSSSYSSYSLNTKEEDREKRHAQITEKKQHRQATTKLLQQKTKRYEQHNKTGMT